MHPHPLDIERAVAERHARVAAERSRWGRTGGGPRTRRPAPATGLALAVAAVGAGTVVATGLGLTGLGTSAGLGP